jgi:transglutaminase-like putative cysteine protease
VLGVLLATPYLACSSSKPPVAVAPLPSVKSSASAHAPPSHEAQSLQGALDPSQFLAAVEVVTSDGLAQDELEILAPNYAGSSFGELTARKLLVGPTAGGRLRVRNAPGYPAPTQAVESRDRRCSFVVDCDELVVRGLIADLRGSSSTIAADDVVTYVYRFIEHKHMARGFDVASIVAEKREGDCTEHAVLTAALLRGTGFPAHVVLGLALVRIDDQWRAFGHAWTEYHDGERWQLADATNVGDAAEKIRYVPVRVMKDEGPGYGRASLEGFDIVDVRTLVVSTRLEP